MTYEEYEKACKIEEEKNNILLDIFEEDLKKAGLKDKTIRNHLSNVNFYINEFLFLDDACSFDEGINMLSEFLGYFFIHKCMWSTPATIKSTAASIKKFYKCMLEHGKIQIQDYVTLCECIKDNMDMWQEDCAIYNDPDSSYFPF